MVRKQIPILYDGMQLLRLEGSKRWIAAPMDGYGGTRFGIPAHALLYLDKGDYG